MANKKKKKASAGKKAETEKALAAETAAEQAEASAAGSEEGAQTKQDKKAQRAAAKAAKAAERAANKPARKAKRKARVSRAGLMAAVAVGCAAMILSVCGIACSGILSSGSDSTTASYELTGGVAATIAGTNITEDTITKQIMSTRTSGGYNKDKSWAQYLVNQGYTPKSLRKELITSYARQYMIEKAEKEYGVEVTDEEVEAQWQKACKSAGGEKKFKKTLKTYGYTKSTYKSSLKSSLAQEKLQDAVAPKKTPSDKKILKYVNENLDTYNDARKSSHILIKVDSDASDEDKQAAKDKAQECLDKINSGELTWDKAVKKYSEDTGSKKSGSKGNKGNVGWDKLTSFVDAYETALEGLSEGQMSEVVESDYGYHIIRCTGYFHVDDSVTEVSQLPKAIKKYVVNIIKSQNSSTKYNTWLEKYIKKGHLKINKMPKDVPYNVSLKGVSSSSSSTSSLVDALTSSTSDSSSDDASSEDTSSEDTSSDGDSATTDESASE